MEERPDEERAAIEERLAADIELREHESFVGLSEAGEIVSELHNVDPTGEGFRYARTMADSPSLPATLTHVDLKKWLGRVLSVGNLLDGIETWIYENAQAEAEMREYYAEEMREYNQE